MLAALAGKLSLVACAALAAVAMLLAATGCGRASAGPSGPVRLDLQPSIAALKERIGISVHGMSGSPVEARLAGATDVNGNAAPWTHLTRSGSSWQGTLPAPSLLGIYLVQLRKGDGARVVGSNHWMLRVFRPGTLSRRSFATPEQVARDWVAHLPGDARLVAMKRWRRPDFDHRDRRLHQLLVIAWLPEGRHHRSDRLGIFVTAVRDGFSGRWRLLEATALPS
jgi:hypothetical protein